MLKIKTNNEIERIKFICSIASDSEALKNALGILNYTKADFIKIETNIKNVDIVKHLSKNKIKVVSHIGITPQKFSDFSKIKSVGKNLNESNHLIKLARKLENAGSKLIVLECIEMSTAKEITKKLTIPTIGIGASNFCDGQVLVTDDIINLDTSSYRPKFIKTYTNIKVDIISAVKNFTKDVKNKKFPSKKYSY